MQVQAGVALWTLDNDSIQPNHTVTVHSQDPSTGLGQQGGSGDGLYLPTAATPSCNGVTVVKVSTFGPLSKSSHWTPGGRVVSKHHYRCQGHSNLTVYDAVWAAPFLVFCA